MGIHRNALTANLLICCMNNRHIASRRCSSTPETARGAAYKPTPEAEAQWVDIINQKATKQDFHIECTPGYYNNKGQLDKGPGFVGGL